MKTAPDPRNLRPPVTRPQTASPVLLTHFLPSQPHNNHTLYFSGTVTVPSSMSSHRSLGDLPLTVQPTEKAVPNISLTVPLSDLAIDLSFICTRVSHTLVSLPRAIAQRLRNHHPPSPLQLPITANHMQQSAGPRRRPTSHAGPAELFRPDDDARPATHRTRLRGLDANAMRRTARSHPRRQASDRRPGRSRLPRIHELVRLHLQTPGNRPTSSAVPSRYLRVR
jgi:hypothetical protein